MADRRRITVSAVGDLAMVRFLDRKIVDPSNIEEVGDEMFQLLEKDKFKNVILNFDGVEFLGSAALNKTDHDGQEGQGSRWQIATV